MSESIRIRTTPNGNDNYVKLKIEQDFDFIEVLSLKITQEEVYQKYCSDYGVVVGRVIANSGFGVPNAKVSIFIPIDEIDKQNSEIFGLYPYETVTDKNSDGIRYNLLPKKSTLNNDCYTPVGTFPNKREILDNEILSQIYCKYYKFTTTTNYAGDFMIFGVPIGTYTLHVDVDISDIGIASQRPYDLIRQGTPEKFFESSTKFKGGTNIDKLVQIKTSNIGVNVQPFWGDIENCEIGITRVDIDLNYTLTPSAIFIGSIYGDQDKESINKRCRPRKKLGEVCEQVVGPGSIEMIRKTVDGDTEEFLVDGGRLIDDDGTWAYQIPMNLDYVVTDETGQLIPSNDPNIGIPTRASVRFRIGMDQNGGEGRLRTRAKFLVPNNPKNINEIDYEFGEKTKISSFKDLYWNKLYTVSNFISRYQKDNTGVSNRNMIGMKNVDACPGDKNPFPYNKVNTEVNPIFFIICLIIKIIGFMIYIMNLIIIPIINFGISIIRGIVDFINALGGNLQQVDYVSCLSVQCPGDDGAIFAPGCKADSNGFEAASPPLNYYCGDADGHTCNFVDLVGLDNCIAFEMAQSLDLFEFDFYNDWINGTLFSYLLKYKKKRQGKERFCEYDCADYVNIPSYTGADGNENGIPDNDCYNNIMLDSCYGCTTDNCQKEFKTSNIIREGLIKKMGDELYYASTTHNGLFKISATDIICLGSIFECDWQGFPKLQPLLVQSTYKIPPEIQEKSDDNTQLLESGMVDIGGNSIGLYFSIDCLGIHVNSRQCLNIRHACEMFVDTDEAIIDPLSNNIIAQADGIIGSNDIDDIIGKQFRDAFIVLNSGSTSANSFNLPVNINSEFNLANCPVYDFTSYAPSLCNPNKPSNGKEYVNFIGYAPSAVSSYGQSKHSFYLYFGMIPGRTALDKMNQKYFTTCQQTTEVDLLIDANVIHDLNNNSSGEIDFMFIGGTGPYSYTIIGPNGYYITGNTSSSSQVTGLAQGIYTVSGLDSNGIPVTYTITVNGPPTLYCSVGVTKNSTSVLVPDGEITIIAGNGTPPYTYTLNNENGSLLSSGLLQPNPLIIGGLSTTNANGYTVIINDSNNNSCITTGLTISGPTAINMYTTIQNVTCYNGTDGKITVNVSGAAAPYIVTTTGSTLNYTSNSLNMTGLNVGTYVSTIVDANNSTMSVTSVISSNAPQLTISPAIEISKQCDANFYNIPFKITNGLNNGDSAYIEYRIDNSTTWNYVTIPFVNTSTLMYLQIPKNAIISDIKIRFSDTPTHICHSNVIIYNVSTMQLPQNNLSGNIIRSGTGPYSYTIIGSGGIGQLTSSIGGNMSGLPQQITINSNNPTLLVTITDSVGCQTQVSYP